MDGFAKFCSNLVDQSDIFDRLAKRIQSGDLLRKAELLDRLQSSAPVAAASVQVSGAESAGEAGITDARGREWRRARHVRQLLDREGEDFIVSAYVTLFNRLPDSDGLVNYLTELQSGVSKLEIVSRLRKSTEARKSRLPLAGYRAVVLKTRLRSLFSFAG